MSPQPTAPRVLAGFAAAAAVALALTFASYGPGLRAAFVSDDVNAIVENEWVAGPFDPVGIATNFSWWGQGRSDSPGYRPAATVSFALSRLASGLDPFGFRVANFALHAACVVLLFGLARALGLGLEAAAAAATLFAVLPIHSEAVIWIVGRAELGAAAGFLAAAWLVLVHRRRGSIAALAGAAAAVAVGMAFKENAVTVLAWPLVLMLVLRAQPPAPAAAPVAGEARPRDEGRAARRRARTAAPAREDSAPAPAPVSSTRRDLAALAALAAGVAGYALLRFAANGPVSVKAAGDLLDNPLSVVDPLTRLLGAVAVLGRYLLLTVWPSTLSVDYSYDALGIGPGFRANADTAVAVAFVAAALWAVRRGPGRRDVAAAGLLMAAASYSIVSNTVFVLGTILGERLFYLPSAGLCVAAAALAEPLFASPATRRGAFAAVLALVAAALPVNRQRAAEWLTPVSLFEAAVRAVPRSARAQMELASAYGNAGRVDEALAHFAASLEILPEYASASYNQGNTLARAGRYDEAAAAYRQSVKANPNLARAWRNLALTERLRGNPDGWIDGLRGALLASPGSAELAGELGEALIASGRYAEAVAAYDDLLARGGASATAHFNRGVANHHLGGCAASVEDYRRSAASLGAPRAALAAAAGCLKELGRDAEAAEMEKAAQVANRDTRR